MTLQLTGKEIEFVKALHQKGGSYNLSDTDRDFRNKWEVEIASANRYGLLYHSNSQCFDSYIKYSLTNLGKEMVKNILEHESESWEDRYVRWFFDRNRVYFPTPDEQIKWFKENVINKEA